MKYLHLIAWFVLGFGSSFLWDKGADLRQAETEKTALRSALNSCIKTKREWEVLVQTWGSDQSRCEAVIDFNKAMDVLERETKQQQKAVKK